MFPGGCFFAATSLEMGARPGPVRDRVAGIQSGFTAMLRSFATRAVELEQLPADEDPDRLAFELHAILLGADTKFVLHQDPAVLDLAREVMRRRLGLDEPAATPARADAAALAPRRRLRPGVGQQACLWMSRKPKATQQPGSRGGH